MNCKTSCTDGAVGPEWFSALINFAQDDSCRAKNRDRFGDEE